MAAVDDVLLSLAAAGVDVEFSLSVFPEFVRSGVEELTDIGWGRGHG